MEQFDNRTIYRRNSDANAASPPHAPLVPLQGKTPPTKINIYPGYKRIERSNDGTSTKPQQLNNKTMEQFIRITDENAASPYPKTKP